ncbi:MAG: hypothetical protein KKD09_05710, partial [Gammaproteobacteria bacterium]|nr:hypothetical protein [Gammaproteobacteria bacterium]
LINIMLFGQPELDALLSDPRLRQVRDRVIHRFELPALLADEASAYIDHRLRAAGWHGARLFSAAALTRLVNASDGRARRINLLADKALLAAYAQGATSVEAQHVDSAVRELPLTLAPKAKALGSRWRLAGLSFAMASVISAGVIGLLGWWRMAPTAVATPASEPQVLAARPAVAPAAAPATVAAPAAAVKPAATRVAPARVTASDQRLDALLARTQTLLQQADLGGYTIQLAALDSSTSPDRDLGLATTQIDPTQLFARYSVYQGRTYLSLYSGRFESFRAAALAMNELPAVFKNNRPMVRSWAKIQQEQTP